MSALLLAFSFYCLGYIVGRRRERSIYAPMVAAINNMYVPQTTATAKRSRPKVTDSRAVSRSGSRDDA